MKINHLLFILFVFLISSCGTLNKKNNEDVSEEIVLPKIINQNKSVLYNTKEIYFVKKNNITYKVLYGIGGRYIIIIEDNSKKINFENIMAELIVEDQLTPETLSLSTDYHGMLSGFGLERSGNVKLKLKINSKEDKNYSGIDEELEFLVNIKN